MSLRTNLLILALLTMLTSILAKFAVFSNPVAPGVAAIYLAVAFMIPFALWFGVWGVIAAYLGCFFGAGILSGLPADVSAYWSLADFWQVLIPLAAFRRFDIDVSLRRKRDLLVFLAFGWALNNLVGAGWGSTTLAIGGIIRWDDVPNILVNWFAGNLLVTAIITPLLLRFLTSYVRRAYGREA